MRQSGAVWADANSRARVPTKSYTLWYQQQRNIKKCIYCHVWMHKSPKTHFQGPCYSRQTRCMLPASMWTPSRPYRPASSTSHRDMLPRCQARGPVTANMAVDGHERQRGSWWLLPASVSSSTSLDGAWVGGKKATWRKAEASQEGGSLPPQP